MESNCQIYHFGEINGEGEKIVISEWGDVVETPSGYKLVAIHDAEIDRPTVLPLGRILNRSDR